MTARCTLPAPKRESYSTPDGWATRPWTLQGVRDVKSYGGWFLKGRHMFANAQAAKLAGIPDEA